ncbi:MAG: hypothetical protein LBL86_04755 [Coriobacteriales bacterium]|nr:hypothetical protein [Coriobacteriales bacterium]
MPRFVLCAVSCLLMLTLAACQGAGRASGEGAASSLSNPLGQSVDASATLDIPALGIRLLTPEEAEACLLEGKTVSDVTYHDESQGGPGYSITTTDGFSVYIDHSVGYLSMSSPFSQAIGDVLSLGASRYALLEAAGTATDEALWFCSPEEAVDEARAALGALGLTSSGEVTVYALGHEAMAAAEEDVLGDPTNEDMIAYGKIVPKESWTEADDCYRIILEPEVDGIPLYADDPTRALQSPDYRAGIPAEALVTAEGLVSLTFSALYTVDPAASRTVELLSQEAADRLLEEKYGALIAARPYEVADVRLEYCVRYTDPSRSAVELVPVWSYRIADGAQDGPVEADGMPYRCHFDAVTGEEIL